MCRGRGEGDVAQTGLPGARRPLGSQEGQRGGRRGGRGREVVPEAQASPEFPGPQGRAAGDPEGGGAEVHGGRRHELCGRRAVAEVPPAAQEDQAGGRRGEVPAGVLRSSKGMLMSWAHFSSQFLGSGISSQKKARTINQKKQLQTLSQLQQAHAREKQ